MALTDAQIRAFRPSDTPYKKGAGGGLYIEVFPNGSKLWRWKFRVAGKEKRMALGAYPTVGLADTRKRRDAEKKKLEFGTDPAIDRKRTKAAAKVSAANTFAAVTKEYIDSKMVGEGRAEATISKARWFLEQLELAIGNMPISDVDPQMLLSALKRLEAKGRHETAKNAVPLPAVSFAMVLPQGVARPIQRNF